MTKKIVLKQIVRFTEFLKKILPSPFSLAVILTYLTFLLAWILTDQTNQEKPHFLSLLGFWYKGFWELLEFTMQMMLILVLGYILALTKPVTLLINSLTRRINSTGSAAFWVTFATLLFGYLNWGLALIFGAVLARKIAERFGAEGKKLNYPLVGATGYVGLLVWHGGFSGSAPLKVAEKGHFLYERIGLVPLDDTILSTMNVSMFFVFLVLLPLVMFWLSKKTPEYPVSIKPDNNLPENKENEKYLGGEKLDYSRKFSLLFSLFMLLTLLIKALNGHGLDFINLNFINFTLFALGILLTPNMTVFTGLAGRSIKAATGIMIQFPLYAGIMGVMKYSGLFMVFTDAFMKISNEVTLPFFTFLSAGIVNFFVPSGGGQWAVQGPVVVEAAKQLGVPVSKVVMALAYGDEWTNMLQPFWALPLLGITGLKAKDIVPYTFVLFVVAGVIFTLFLLF
jgi:short-chain fatty acids transporter